MSSERLRGQARDYYETKLRAHGPTPAGVDWNSQESQELRFALLANLWRDEADASILDYGCGYGALADYLRARGIAARIPATTSARRWRRRRTRVSRR